MITTNALESIENVLAFSSRDWSVDKRDAWLWGIVYGWDDPDSPDAMEEVVALHGWTPEEVARLRGLHADFVARKYAFSGAPQGDQ